MSQTPQQNTPQELARKTENIASFGVVRAVNLKAARCRVEMGENVTTWIPWTTGRAAGKDGSHWWAPKVGEQCLVIAPGGDLLQGVAILGVYSTAMASPSNRDDVEYTRWSEKDYAEYAPEAHTTHHEKKIRAEVSSDCSSTMEPQQIRFELGSGCSIVMKPNQITMQAGAVTLQIGPDKVTSNMDVVAGGISLMTHVHTEVTKGVMTSGVPLGAGGGIPGGVAP